jgi:raffinose/stachyose/melibiose transport system substrate-binding protein
MRRVRSITVGLAAMAMVGTTLPAVAQESTEVTVWSWRIEDEPAYEQMFAAFTAANPGITVRFEPTVDTEYETRLTTALQAGEGPDIAQLKPYGELQPIIQAGYLEPLDGVVSGLADFYQTALDGAKSVADGRIYGVPYALPNMGVFYNTKIFADNGIAVPTTYAEFIAAAETLKAAGITPIAAGGANGTAWALEIGLGVIGPGVYGGNEFWDEMQSGAADFTDPRWVATLQRFADLYPYLPAGFEGVDYVTATQMFINEEAAMYLGGSFENGSFKIQNPDLQFSIFSFPPDVAGEPAITSSFADGSYGLIAGAEHRDAALKVLEFMASAEWAQLYADLLGWPPARPGVVANDPALQEMIKMEEHSTPYLTLVGFRWQQPTASSIIQADIIPVITGAMPAAELAQKIQDGISTWFVPTPAASPAS